MLGKNKAYRSVEPVVISSVVKSPLNSVNEAGHESFVFIVEHLDGDEVAPLGNTISCSSDGSGNVGSVAVSVPVC